MSNTKIEWTDRAWNPITGCTPISEGCQNCYAKRFAQRFRGRFGYPVDDPFRVTFHPDRIELPLHWKKPQKIFVNSMGDLFHEYVHRDLTLRVWNIMEACSQHIFQILTKRPDAMYNRLEYWMYPAMRISLFREVQYPLKNVWLGVTVENAKHKDRIDILRKIPAAVRFISFEPLLGDVGEIDLTGIHWVIVGGETGPGARWMASGCVFNIFNQCKEQRVPFFFKKWGKKNPDRPWYEVSDTRKFPNSPLKQISR